MSTSTVSTPLTAPRRAMARSLEFSQRISRHLWRALTPSAEGPARGRTLEAVRRVMETRIDAARLRERLPELAQHRDTRERVWAQLLPLYRRFVARVSPPAQSMSLEVAGFVAHVCERCRPPRVLEVGTGFASPVLRTARRAARVAARDLVRRSRSGPAGAHPDLPRERVPAHRAPSLLARVLRHAPSRTSSWCCTTWSAHREVRSRTWWTA